MIEMKTVLLVGFWTFILTGVAASAIISFCLVLWPRRTIERLLAATKRRRTHEGDMLLARLGALPPYRWLLSGQPADPLLEPNPDLRRYPRMIAAGRTLGLATLTTGATMLTVILVMLLWG
jgi:hypothetical protein